MAKEHEIHQLFLDSLLGGIQTIKSIRLVARVYDPRIGNPDNDRVYFFIPDLHIISRKLKEKYTYGFNHERTFIDLLKKLRELRKNETRYSLTVCQIGDFVDLWKENKVDPRPILADYQGVRDYLYDLGEHSLNARFLLGNHDAEIALVPGLSLSWHHRLFFPAGSPRVYATHGDIFDWIETTLPDFVQKFAVHHFSPKENAPHLKSGLEKFIEFKTEKSRPVSLNAVPVLGALRETEGVGLPEFHNVNAEKHKFLDLCFQRVQKMNRDSGAGIAAAVIGHTHRAGMNVKDDSEGFMVLMDCGAWIGDFKESPDGERNPNCQVGVVCGNDFRIYQVDPKSKQFESKPVL